MKLRIQHLILSALVSTLLMISCGDETNTTSAPEEYYDASTYYPLETGRSWLWVSQDVDTTRYLQTTVTGTWTLRGGEGYALIDTVWDSNDPEIVETFEHYQRLANDTLLFNDPRIPTCGSYDGWLLKHIINPNRIGDYVPSLDYTYEQTHFGNYRWRVVSGDTTTTADGVTYENCIMLRNEFERIQVDAEHPEAVYPLQDRYFAEGIGLVRFEYYELDYEGSPSTEPSQVWEMMDYSVGNR